MYEEFGQIAEKNGIKEWMGKQVDRKYAFEMPDIPQEGNYLKVLYSFDRKLRLPHRDKSVLNLGYWTLTLEPQLPLDTSGKTFSHVFGANTSAFELFVLKRKIMGPCWLNIQEPELSDKAVSMLLTIS